MEDETALQSAEQMALERLKYALLCLKSAKRNDRSQKDRAAAIVITEMEKAIAVYQVYVTGFPETPVEAVAGLEKVFECADAAGKADIQVTNRSLIDLLAGVSYACQLGELWNSTPLDIHVCRDAGGFTATIKACKDGGSDNLWWRSV